LAILNYTTEISVEKTVMEIEKMLVQAGAEKILKDYDGSGIVAISFVIETDKGKMPVKLPMNARAVMQVINDQTEQYVGAGYKKRRVVPRSFYNDMDQARRVGWRIIKDWTESQLALIFLRMVKIQEIFLPYIIGINGKTLYEQIESQNFKGFLLEDKTLDR
jgi:hypothetical protein